MKIKGLIILLNHLNKLMLSKEISGIATPQHAFQWVFDELIKIFIAEDIQIEQPILDYHTVFEIVKETTLYDVTFDGDRIPIKITNKILKKLQEINNVNI